MSAKNTDTPKATAIKKQSSAKQRWQSFASVRYGPYIELIILLVVVFAGVNLVRSFIELRHLDWVSDRFKYVQSQLENRPDFAANVKNDKYCSYTNHLSDFEEGDLRCGVRVTGMIAADSHANLVSKSGAVYNLIKEAKAFGDSAQFDSDFDGTFRVKGQNLNCGVMFSNSPSVTASSKKFTTDFTIQCDAPASRQFYPVVS
jgi:hypothetical protein